MKALVAVALLCAGCATATCPAPPLIFPPTIRPQAAALGLWAAAIAVELAVTAAQCAPPVDPGPVPPYLRLQDPTEGWELPN
jgi:hypothetical protein